MLQLGGGGQAVCYWPLANRGQGCCEISYNVQDRTAPQQRMTRYNMSPSIEVENLYLEVEGSIHSVFAGEETGIQRLHNPSPGPIVGQHWR